jgi:hypothetical protein
MCMYVPYIDYTMLLVLGDILCSFCGNLKNVCVYAYYTFIVVPTVSMEIQIMSMYIYFSVVLVPGDPLHSNVDTSIRCVLYIPYAFP